MATIVRNLFSCIYAPIRKARQRRVALKRMMRDRREALAKTKQGSS